MVKTCVGAAKQLPNIIDAPVSEVPNTVPTTGVSDTQEPKKPGPGWTAGEYHVDGNGPGRVVRHGAEVAAGIGVQTDLPCLGERHDRKCHNHARRE
jgi:hypothetical protein